MKPKHFKLTLTVLLTLTLMFSLFPAAALSQFDDVPESAWYFSAVTNMTEKGLVESGGSFRPNAPITADELHGLLSAVLPVGDSSVGGDGIFTRERLAVMLHELLAGHIIAEDGGEAEYVDAGEIDASCMAAVLYAYRAGLMRGVGGGRFDPKGIVTRAQAAVVLDNVMTRLVPLTGTLTLYTSMRDSMIVALVDGFMDKHPGIVVETRIAGAGTLMREIEAQRGSDGIIADVIWTSEVPDFYYMRDEGLLLQYRPSGADDVLNPLDDTDDHFIPARLGTMGIAYNTDLVESPPAFWRDLLGSAFTGGFAIADPTTSGTASVSVGLLMDAFGEQFFRDLRENGAFVGQGSSQVVDSVAKGELAACLAVDYMVFAHAEAGAPIAIAYPQEMLVIPSPAAIFKDSPNLAAAKLFVDYLISVQAQQIIANNGTLPAHSNITVPEKFNLPTVAEAMDRSIRLDDDEMYMRIETLVNDFLDIMKD